METNGSDEPLTTSLLEEVFNSIDSKTSIIQPPIKTSSGFLLDEYSTDLEVALGKRKDGIKESSNVVPKPEIVKECSLIHEDEINDLAEDDPFRDGENKEWITSRTNFGFNSQESSNYFSDGTPRNQRKWPEIKSISEKLKKEIYNNKETFKESSKDLLVEPIFHMRIINPKVSSVVLREKMIGRKSVPPFRIKRFIESTDTKNVNWVTGGAIVGKLVTKSQKGNQYCIWTLSDLSGDIKMVSVFLFGNAFKEYWKLSLGVVVGILNPLIMNNKNHKTEATLRVDNSDRIMVFGTSKDYGVCRSKRANGENCTAVVNRASCEYCIYHVKQVYDKASRRPELQASFTGSGLMNLRNKVLGKNEVFYGGKSYMAIKGRQTVNQSLKEKQKMRLLPSVPTDTSKITKDQELLKRLDGKIKTKSESEATSNKHGHSTNFNDKIGQNKQTNELKQNMEKMIDLDFPITNKQVLRAKANAIKFIRKNGPLKKPVENISVKKTPEQIKSIKRKLEIEEVEKKRMKIEDTPKSLLQQKMERSGITEKFLELMNSQSENPELLKEAESEEREKYFKRLEIKEKMEEKMASTYKLDCKAVRCLKCNYKSFSPADLCKKEKHPLKLVNAVKRFWKCGDCSARTVCLELVPLHSCKVCGSSKWERASMLPEKKAKLLPNETLSIRGHEEKFVGSVVQNPNINLLVPEES